MKRFIENFKKYRFLLTELVKKDIKLKYRRSYLGILWTLLEPLLTMIVLTIVFGGMFGNKDPQFPVYILTGRLLYTYFSNSTKSSTKSIRSNSGMIKKVYVPKYMYPLSTILSNYVTFLISLIILVVVGLVFKVKIGRHTLFAVVPLFTLFLLTLGIGLILATLSVFFRDLEYLWGVVLMLVMYTCAIFYKADRLKEAAWILKINPLYSCIYNFRTAILGTAQYPLSRYHIVFSLVCAMGSIAIGLIIFYRNQDDFILNI